VTAPTFQAFADEWVAAWNAHDLDRILSHYAETIVFRSPVVRERFGKPSGEVSGKEELRAYWSGAFRPSAPSLRFELIAVLPGVDGGAIRYFSHVRGCEVVETFTFDDAGLVNRAAAFYAG
jgi:ketosteroid isomerase-like protein